MWLMRDFLGNERSGDEGNGMIARCEHWELSCEIMKSWNIQQKRMNVSMKKRKARKAESKLNPTF